jgi:SPP1 gp7 family putative phage head morphogenesis protein
MSTPPNEVRQWDEAVLWFLARVPMTKAEWNKLSARARRRAFTVAGVAQADVLHDVFKGIDRAVAKRTGLEEFRKSVGQKLRSAWQGSVKNPAWRLETIYRTNVQHAYSAGRWAQMTDPVVTKHRPFGMFDAILDNRVTERCEELDGTILAWEEWQKRGLVPPLHFNCRSGLRSLRKSQAEKKPGWGKTPPDVASQDGFGLPPQSAEWQPDLEKYPPELRNHVQSRLAGADALEPMQAPEGARFMPAPSPPVNPTREPRGTPEKAAPDDLPTVGKDGHIKEFVSVLEQEETEHVLLGVKDSGLLEWLRRHPLARLQMLSSVRENGERVLGKHHGLERAIGIDVSGEIAIFGEAFDWGNQDFVAGAARTLLDHARRVLVHELAHHLLTTLGDEWTDKAKAAWKRARAASALVSGYARWNEREYFSETFLAFVYHGDALAKRDPDGYALIQEALNKVREP